MGRCRKIPADVLRGTGDANIRFSDLTGLLEHPGFQMRIKGSHHIFLRQDVVEILNLRPRQNKAQSYQAKPILDMILKYHMEVDDAAKT